jgi:gliding motility-associated-like protein
MERKITSLRLTVLLLFMFVMQPKSYGQVYLHEFGTTTISAHPYNVAPGTLNPDLSGSSWSNSTNAWTSFNGLAGQALSLNNSSGTPTITLTFNVAANKQLSITSFDFWRQRSTAGAQQFTIAVNGTQIGNGTVPTNGALLGQTAVSTPIAGLTGTVTITIGLSGATGAGTFRLDNFTLNGAVTSTCIPPVVTTLLPASGPSNTLVTINGIGFSTGTGTTAVKFNGQPSTGFTVVSDTQIKAIVPATASTGPVSITSNGCEAIAANFNVLQSNCPGSTLATELFISEIFDAEIGEGGVIELYNGTANAINLSAYSITRYADVGDTTPTFTAQLSGTIAAGQAIIVRTAVPVCSLTGTPATNLLGTGFNANDQIRLLKNNVAIDVVNMPLETGFQMFRNPNIIAPSTTYTASQWAITLTENCATATFGAHTVNTNAVNQITAQPFSAAICEAESVTYTVTLTNATGFSYQWKRLNTAGVWVNITDGTQFSGATTANLTINQAALTLNNAQFYCEVTAAGCTLVSNAVQLTVSPLPIAIVTIVPPTCVTPTGSILIVPSIGDGLTYSTNGTTYQTSPLFTGLASGTYTLYVKSSANCISEIPFTINPVPALPAVVAVTPIQPGCGATTGSITVNSPLDLGLTYSIDGTNFQNGTTFTNLAPGTYTVTVMTVLGCTSVSAVITILPAPAVPPVATTAVTAPTCTVLTGTIAVTNPTGNGFTYSINGGPFQTAASFAGLAPGTYIITTQNAAGCTSVTPAITVIPAPAAPAAPIAAPTQPTCTIATGTITITPPTGTGFTYSLNGGTYQAGTVFAGLAPGTYAVTTQNAAGCTSAPTNITIDAAPATPSAPAAVPTQPTCIVTTGTITVTPPAGTGFTYSINGGTYQASTVFAGLAPGSYAVTTQNAAGCTSAATTIIIDAVPAPPAVPVVSFTQPDCATGAKGSITVLSPTGTQYTYSIDGGTTYQNGTGFNNIEAGTYTVMVQNASGCTAVSAQVTINAGGVAPAVAVATTTPPTCTVATGSIEVTSPLGTDLTYSIDGTNFQVSPIFTNVAPGAYQITVLTTGGCTSTSAQVTVAPSPVPASAVTTITPPSCFDAQGSVVITSPTGSGFTYSIDGTTFQNGTTFINLDPGTYNITIQNLQGCTSVTPITINAAPALPTAPFATVTPPTCDNAGGVITVTSPLGSDLTYSINGTNFQQSTTFTGLTAGSYTVTVSTAAGCTASTSGFVIGAATGNLQVAAAEGCEPTTMGNQYVLHVMAENGSFDENAVTFTWMNENGLVVSTESSFNATQYVLDRNITSIQFPLEFMVTVSTPGGCTGNATFVVYGTFCDIPKGVSPNGDTLNDTFDLTGMNASKVSIFNRYGQQVFSRNNYTNEWFGQTDNSEELPSGTYYYVVDMPTGTKTGWIYLNREEK